MNYQSFPLEDRTWERPGRKAGTKVAASWRGAPLRHFDLPTGPRLAWGSRTGSSLAAKGVYMGSPALPRFPYADAKGAPSLGPPSGLAKRIPKKVMPDWDDQMYSHLAGHPVSFVLEGIVGFNVTVAAQIRGLREQLHQAETIYKREHGELDANIAAAGKQVQEFADALEAEEISIERKTDDLKVKHRLSQALRYMSVCLSVCVRACVFMYVYIPTYVRVCMPPCIFLIERKAEERLHEHRLSKLHGLCSMYPCSCVHTQDADHVHVTLASTDQAGAVITCVIYIYSAHIHAAMTCDICKSHTCCHTCIYRSSRSSCWHCGSWWSKTPRS